MNQNTAFFRDRFPFECLKDLVIPRLLEARKQEKTIRIWSAGCSRGQEPYSIAMTLADNFDLSGWMVSILASDTDPLMISATQKGFYSDFEIQNGMTPEFWMRHFQRIDGGWQASPRLRSMVRTSLFNLCGRWPAFQKTDVVFLRHVLCHLEETEVNTIVAKVQEILNPDGYLFIGQGISKAKSCIQNWFHPFNPNGFRPVLEEKHCCYRIGGRA